MVDPNEFHAAFADEGGVARLRPDAELKIPVEAKRALVEAGLPSFFDWPKTTICLDVARVPTLSEHYSAVPPERWEPHGGSPWLLSDRHFVFGWDSLLPLIAYCVRDDGVVVRILPSRYDPSRVERLINTSVARLQQMVLVRRRLGLPRDDGLRRAADELEMALEEIDPEAYADQDGLWPRFIGELRFGY